MANCNDYISADDLKTGKQAILHIEHVAKSRDAAGNPALEVTDTIRGESVTNPTLDGFFSSVGFKPADGSFEDSGTINHRWETLLYESEGNYYQWMGALPKVVPVGSTPATTGGISPNAWVDQTDLTLRTDLKKNDGYNLLGYMNYAGIRSYTGNATSVYCIGVNDANDGGFGYFDRMPLGSSDADNGGTILVDASGRRWKRRMIDRTFLGSWFGVKADWNGSSGTDNITAINKTLSAVPANKRGEVVLPAGEIMFTDMISVNRSNITVRGCGNRVTHLVPRGITQKAALEVNNGSWDYTTNTYTYGGVSIGHVILKDFSMDGDATTSTTGIVFARATLGCRLENLTIENFSVNHRAYGSWYARMQNVILANGSVNMYMDYATNDWSAIACEFICGPKTNIHFESQGNGTNIAVSFVSCSFDGLPQQSGCYFKGIYNLSFSGSTYAEVYPTDLNLSAPFFLFGKTSVGVDFSGVHMIAGTGYAGTFVTCGTGNDFGVNTMKIDACFLYKSGENTCNAVDTQFGTNVEFGTNRFEAPLIINNQQTVVSSAQTSTFVPSLPGTSEMKIPIAVIRKTYSIPILRISVKFLTNASITGSQRIRIVDQQDNVIIDYPFTGTINAGTTINLTDIASDGYVTTTGKAAINSVKPKGMTLNLWTYKVGASSDWPMMSVIVEHA